MLLKKDKATLAAQDEFVATGHKQDTIDFSLIELLPNGRVSARKLYKFLQLRQADVSRWLDSKILNNEFAIENEDYWGFRIVAEGNQIMDYELSPNFAKKICMMSKSNRGEEARNYFLAMEQKANNTTFEIPKTLSQALLLASQQAEIIEKQELQLTEQKPKVEYAEQLLQSTNGLDFATSAKVLNLPFGRNKLFQICRENFWLDSKNQPYQNFVNEGYFLLLETSFLYPSGDCHLSSKTMLTAKGQEWLTKQLKKLNYI
jgi:anti-repressor protein